MELESHVECLDVFSINAAAAAGNFQIRLNVQNENLLSSNGIEVRQGSSRATHSRFFGSSEETRGINKEAQVGIETAVHIIQRYIIRLDHKFEFRNCNMFPFLDLKLILSKFPVHCRDSNMRIRIWLISVRH